MKANQTDTVEGAEGFEAANSEPEELDFDIEFEEEEEEECNCSDPGCPCGGRKRGWL